MTVHDCMGPVSRLSVLSVLSSVIPRRCVPLFWQYYIKAYVIISIKSILLFPQIMMLSCYVLWSVSGPEYWKKKGFVICSVPSYGCGILKMLLGNEITCSMTWILLSTKDIHMQYKLLTFKGSMLVNWGFAKTILFWKYKWSKMHFCNFG